MAIDKTIPNRLQADADQRLVRPEVGEMLDAQNVTMAEGGGSSSGVIKNVRGTLAGEPLTAADRIADDDVVRVIGSVSDPQRGFIYWFVADVSGSSQDAIYQYNTSDDTYRIVFKGQYLDFDPNGFVKGDVVNAAFQQDGVIQSILYFTDNNNPPRKINVDRSIGQVFNGLSSSQLDYCLNVIKPAPTRVPTTSFSTDESILINNFVTSQFQIATQFIYIDGEESAISGYSKLTFPDASSVVGLEQASSAKLYYEDNVCNIDTKVSFGSNVNPLNSSISPPDVEKIRILARQGNNGSFFVIDEVSVSESLTREVYGSDVEVYNRDNGIYRWYNDGNGSSISSVDQNKLYDNVPFQAQGLSLSGNRLMMSNYTEGRANHNPGASITVAYNSERDGGSNSSAGSPISWDNANPSDGGTIEVDLTQSFSSATQEVPSGSRTVIQFEFDAIGSFYGPTTSDTDILNVSATPYVNGFPSGSPEDFRLSVSNTQQIELIDTPNVVFDLTIVNSEDTTPQGLLQSIADEFEGLTFSKEYATTNNGGLFSLTKVGDTVTIPVDTADYNLRVDFSFNDYTISGSGANAKIEVFPYITNVEFVGLSSGYPQGSVFIQGSDGIDYYMGGQSMLISSFDQGDLSYSFNSGLVTLGSITSTVFVIDRSFKAGATHELGVVYYDKYNRSGNVNRIGSFYVNHFAERTQDFGSSSVQVSFDNDAPEWAERYQFVYPGNSTYSSWVTHSVGGGFFEIEDPITTSGPPWSANENKKQVYVSLNTLESAKDQKGSLVDYSFTKGDKLRVISYDNTVGSSIADPTVVYPTASDGSIIEFNVLGVKVFGQEAENPLHGASHSQGLSVDPHVGTFLVLDAPQVNGGVADENGNDIRYPGFDWFSITNTTYPDGVTQQNLNLWKRRCVVEILTPRLNEDEKVWYEIGEDYPVAIPKTPGYSGSNHGSTKTIDGGEVFFRAASMPSPFRDGTEWSLEKNEYRSENIIVESQRASDYFGDKSWDRGRPHVVFEDSATVRRYNGITYSDAYAEDVANLSLSSFNPSLANFFSLDSVNGACNCIDTFRDGYLLAFQENRVSRIGVNKDIITTPTAGQIPTLTTQVLGEPVYYLGDFGCGDNPESVLIRDGNAFFVDTSRKKLVRLTAEGLSPISENGVDSMFKTNLDSFTEEGGTRIVSGYDPEDNQYYVTLREAGAFTGFTLGYNISAGVWQSRYTFYPDMYADQNGTMYSAYYNNPVGDDNAEVFHHHTNETDYNTFYGSFGDSLVKVVSNSSPSMVKVFNSISLEGNSANWTANPVATDLSSLAQSKQFVEKEGSYYSEFTRDTNGTKHITGIGRVASLGSGGNRITFVNRVNRNPIPYGSNIRLISAGAYDNIGSLEEDVTFVKFVDSYTIEVAGTINILLNGLVGGDLVAISESTVNGDPVRGHWAEITLTNNQATPFELYCVNTHIVQSHQDHSLGQQ